MMRDFKPHEYQRYAIDRLCADEHVGLFLDMGLGKTVIVLTALDKLIYDQLAVCRALVIAPKRVSEATWQDEAAKWCHLSRLTIATALGEPNERRAAVEQGADLTIINRENTAWLVDAYAKNWPFDMLIVDESSSFKNHDSRRFRALKTILPRFRRSVILTGTPAPNGLTDLWAQIYLLDRGERLGRYVSHYRQRYFDYNPWRHSYAPKEGAFEAIQEKLSDICVSMKAADWLALGDMTVHDVPVKLSDIQRDVYRKLEKEMLLPLGDADEVTALTAASLTNKLLQLCGGAVYDDNHGAHVVHDAKLEALSELIEGLQGEHCLLFYGFLHEIPRLKEACKGKRVRVLLDSDDVSAWNAGLVDVLIAHPASCSYGLNLQAGGHHVVWYTLPWALEQYEQANARLHRQGQEKPVIVHRLLVKGGMDEVVAAALSSKADVQGQIMEALKRRCTNDV